MVPVNSSNEAKQACCKLGYVMVRPRSKMVLIYGALLLSLDDKNQSNLVSLMVYTSYQRNSESSNGVICVNVGLS